MKFLVLWHVYDRQGGSRYTPDQFLGSVEKVITCHSEEFADARLNAEKDFKKEIKERAGQNGKETFLGKIIFAKHEAVMKVHQIILLS